MKYLRTLVAVAIFLLVACFVQLALTQQFTALAYSLVSAVLATVLVYTIIAMSEGVYAISFDAMSEQLEGVLAQRDARDQEIAELRMQLLNASIDSSNQPTDPWVRAAVPSHMDARDEEEVAQEA